MNIDQSGVVGVDPEALEGDFSEGRGDWNVSERGTRGGPRIGRRARGRPRRRPLVGHQLVAIVIAFSFVAAAWIFFASHVVAHDDDDDDEGENPTFTVDNDKVECPLAQYTTIQAAVAAAAAMAGTQTIRVCAGTYTGNVVIGTGNSLVLRGDGADKVFLRAAASTAGPIIDVSAAGQVVIRGMTVDGQSTMVGSVVYGIRFTDTSGTIRDVHVLNVRGSSDTAEGIAIRAEGGTSAPTVRIKNNLVDDYTRVGIIANGVNGPINVRITENKVIGPDPLTVHAPNGIQVSRGAIARVEDNKISGATVAPGNPDAGVGSGILLFCAGPTRVKENHVTESDLGIALADTAGSTVSQNRVEDSAFDAYSLEFGLTSLFGPLGCPGPNPSLTENNVVRDNRARDSGENGISFVSFDSSFPKQPFRNTVSKNDVRDSGLDGIAIFNGAENVITKNRVRDSGQNGIAVYDGADNQLIKNRIRGSVDFDAKDDTTGAKTAATANTWKENRCKTSSPTGLCQEEKDDDDAYSPGTRGSGTDPNGDGMAITATAPGSMDWHSFGTAENAKDPVDPSNDVVVIDTSNPLIWGAVTRDLNATIGDLTGHLAVDYYIVPIEVPSPLPGGSNIVISRGCGGGPPRFELGIDLDGDGKFDGNAIGYIGPPPFTGCAQNKWQHQDLTDDGLRWNLMQLGGLPLNTWAQVLAFFGGYANHKVVDGTMADDSELIPVLGGIAYYDNIAIGDQTLTKGP